MITLSAVLPAIGDREGKRVNIYPDIRKRIEIAVGQFDLIGEQRKEKLEELSAYVRSQNRLGPGSG
ncbi:MAG: hypothetical protein U9Q07_07885 [Planctomycetota bacterium]|nr:hypothetical protein [Planctomycetota bacterium]